MLVSRPALRPFHTRTAAFAAGTETPREHLERCLEMLAALEPNVHAFTHVDLAAARRTADAATARWHAGRPLSPIDGIPIGIKDIIETADLPTEMGSPLFAGFRSGKDAASVAALREAGAVIVGKTVTTEFAATVPGPTRNPWDLQRTPGGSSSGSGAAVGSGMLSAALGTQVVGSILRPASFCGCVGYKPSLGGIHRGGSLDYLSQSCQGVLAASIEDAWLVARETSARAGGDPGFRGIRGPQHAPPSRRPRALALLETPGWPHASADARAQLQAALATVRSAGITILDRTGDATVARVEDALADAMPLTRKINTWEFRWPLNTFARDLDRAKLSTLMQDRLADAERMTLEEYGALLDERDRARATYAQLAGVCDGAITLAATGPAPLGLESTGDAIFVVAGTFLGVPALSLPFLETERLPLGLQCIGFSGEDAGLFAIAAALRDLLAPQK